MDEKEKKDPQEISGGRKSLYYIGMALIFLGFILFISTFFQGFGDDPFSGGQDAFINAPIGMVLIIVGAILMSVGARGAAGSGLVLDPKRAREDLTPFTKAAGGMLKDALEETDLLPTKEKREEKIMVRCPSCKGLNDEDARFCKSCGNEL